MPLDRRQFLNYTGAAVAGATLFPLAGCRKKSKEEHLKVWTWVRGSMNSEDEWRTFFQRIRGHGVDAVLMDRGAQEVARLVPIAKEFDIEVHVWVYTMMRSGHEETHPEWYAVNKLGKSTATDPPYVGYYKFLCPSREPVREHLVEAITTLSEVEGLAGVHLDYIRYPDVILPVALQPTYDLVQDREYPEFDYCYCDVCRERFTAQSGIDPSDLEDPAANDEWVQYRYDSITTVVNELGDVVRSNGKQITAAVFPTPSLAKTLVRQDWTNWNLDAVFPMIYQNFYNETVDWVEAATREGVSALGESTPLHAGLYIPKLTPLELVAAIQNAIAGGAAGVSLFEGRHTSAAHWGEMAAFFQSA